MQQRRVLCRARRRWAPLPWSVRRPSANPRAVCVDVVVVLCPRLRVLFVVGVPVAKCCRSFVRVAVVVCAVRTFRVATQRRGASRGGVVHARFSVVAPWSDSRLTCGIHVVSCVVVGVSFAIVGASWPSGAASVCKKLCLGRVAIVLCAIDYVRVLPNIVAITAGPVSLAIKWNS